MLYVLSLHFLLYTFYLCKATHLSDSVSCCFLSDSLLYNKATHFLMKSDSLLNVMYISKHYFVDVYISLLNIWWSYPEKVSFKFTLFTLYLIHLHYKFYILHYNFLSFMLSILSLTFQVISFIL